MNRYLLENKYYNEEGHIITDHSILCGKNHYEAIDSQVEIFKKLNIKFCSINVIKKVNFLYDEDLSIIINIK